MKKKKYVFKCACNLHVRHINNNKNNKKTIYKIKIRESIYRRAMRCMRLTRGDCQGGGGGGNRVR